MPATVEYQLVKILRKDAVAKRCGLGKSTVDQLVRAGKFPAPIKLTRVAIGWRLSDIDQWLSSRPSASRARVDSDSPRSAGSVCR